MRVQQQNIKKAASLEAKNVNLETSYNRTVEGSTHMLDEVKPNFLSPKGWIT
jgi:hypothetical protein